MVGSSKISGSSTSSDLIRSCMVRLLCQVANESATTGSTGEKETAVDVGCNVA